MENAGAVRWKLRDIMKQHRVTGTELGKYLNVNKSTVSTWRNSKYFPEINEKRWVQISCAINDLSKIGGGINPLDLVEYLPNERPLDDVLGYRFPRNNNPRVPNKSAA